MILVIRSIKMPLTIVPPKKLTFVMFFSLPILYLFYMNEIGTLLPVLLFLAVVMSIGILVSIVDFFMDLFEHEDK